MEVNRGNFRERYDHPNIIVRAEAAFRAGAQWILADIEEQIRSGTIFHSGDTAQVGWMTVMLDEAEGGELEVFEPESGSMPVRWVQGANVTIRQITIQKELCDQLGVTADYPSMRQSAVISPDFMESNLEFELSRDVSAENDSGWVLREGDYKDSNGVLSSLYQISIAVPSIIPFLALPAGSIIKRDRVRLEVSLNNIRISSSDNDFLARLLESVYFRK